MLLIHIEIQMFREIEKNVRHLHIETMILEALAKTKPIMKYFWFLFSTTIVKKAYFQWNFPPNKTIQFYCFLRKKCILYMSILLPYGA